jgi:S-adenosylmethionine:tRNA ribosyltransferase-isomerase
MPLTLKDFDFDLPQELIAQHPAATRSASRLLKLSGGAISDHLFSTLPELLAAGDLLVLNDTRVIKARLYGEKSTGGKIEVLIERPTGSHEALAQVRASKKMRPGALLILEGSVQARVIERQDDLYRLCFETCEPLLETLELHGRVPLPPYIGHTPAKDDESRYQTVYARVPGAVAAPTAGLHFDQALMDVLAKRGVRFAWLTLHVGAGTFQPVRTEDIAQHRMHPEWYVIPEATRAAVLEARARHARVVAVGTTSMRALESAAKADAQGGLDLATGAAETRLFIVPGFAFRVVDLLITNFHLPRTTLLMLVSAFGGMDAVRRAYAHAVDRRYRFYSYGDAMLVSRDALESGTAPTGASLPAKRPYRPSHEI